MEDYSIQSIVFMKLALLFDRIFQWDNNYTIICLFGDYEVDNGLTIN